MVRRQDGLRMSMVRYAAASVVIGEHLALGPLLFSLVFLLIAFVCGRSERQG